MHCTARKRAIRVPWTEYIMFQVKRMVIYTHCIKTHGQTVCIRENLYCNITEVLILFTLHLTVDTAGFVN